MSRKHKFNKKEGAYFISFATVFWIDVFTRMEYFDIVINALDCCGYCIMSSHTHWLFRSEEGEPRILIIELLI